MAEHDRITRFFAPLADGEPGSFHLTDDAAMLDVPAGHKLVITTDSVIEGIHVLPMATPGQFARKLVRRNLSDLAAMGARPWRYFLNLHSASFVRKEWTAAFAATLAEEQAQFGMVLAGGDTTSGGERMHLTMTCLGLLQGAPLLRSTAQVGDDVHVSGTIGDAGLGLLLLQQRLQHFHGAEHLCARYHTPEPRLALGQHLHGIASACLDISDGLLADAAQLAQASGVQLQLQRDAIPLSDAVRHALHDEKLWTVVLGGGDDYELLFTAPSTQREAVAVLGATRIGTVAAGAGIMLDGATVQHQLGYEHP